MVLNHVLNAGKLRRSSRERMGAEVELESGLDGTWTGTVRFEERE